MCEAPLGKLRAESGETFQTIWEVLVQLGLEPGNLAGSRCHWQTGRLTEGGVITAALREPTIQARGVAVAKWKASTGLSQIAGPTSGFLVFASQV